MAAIRRLPVLFRVALRVRDPSYRLNSDDVARLGPLATKLGQTLASRPDLVGEEMCSKLRPLLDDSSPRRSRQTKAMRALVRSRVVKRIDPIPLASASLASVHRGVMEDGTEIAVKVLLPNTRGTIEFDEWLLRFLLAIAGSFGASSSVLTETLDEVSSSLLEETDLSREGPASLEVVPASEDSWLRAPRPVYWDRDALVTELVRGTRRIDEAGDCDLAPALWRFYVRSVLEGRRIHADPHAGNVSVDEDGRVVLFDFGLTCFVPLSNDFFVACFDAFLNGGWLGLAARLEHSGVILPGPSGVIDLERTADVLRASVFGPGTTLTGKALKAMGGESHSDAPFVIAPDLLKLARAFVTLEGLCLVIDPSFNSLAATIEEFVDFFAKKL